MKTSTEIISAADLIGEQKAIEYIARAGFDAWDFSMFSMCDYDWDKKTAILTNHPLSSPNYLAFARKLKQTGLDNGIVCNQSHAPFPSCCVKVRSYNLKALHSALEDMRDKKGVRVIIAEEPCVLYARRRLKKAAAQVAYVAEQGADAQRCLEELACPAFYRNGEDVAVDENLCTGCMVCLQVAPKAFKARKRA